MSIKISQPHDKWDERYTIVNGNIRLCKSNEILVIPKTEKDKVYVAVKRGDYRMLVSIKTEEEWVEMSSKLKNLNNIIKDNNIRTVVTIINNLETPYKYLRLVESTCQRIIEGQVYLNQIMVASCQRLEFI